MCGILGFLNPQGLSESDSLALAEQMGNTIRHRGPDDHGEWCDADAGIVLGHRRLSINDLSPAGHQPMVSASGRYVIVLNGEIYNFLDLRRDLEAAGQAYPFKGHSDTEVALAMFERHGFAAALPHFVGMFALGVWDRRERALYLARDRVGEKPLYYTHVAQQFVFASDLRALQEFPGWSPQIDRDALGLMMQHFYIPAPRTIYKNVYKLMPGTWLRIDHADIDPAITPTTYWSAADIAVSSNAASAAVDPAQAIDALDQILRRTIRDKMISDVPLGAFLSGGIDSSTIVALMQAESARPVKTFSIGFNEAGYNEAREAKRVAAHLGTEHTELYLSSDEARAVIPKIPELYSEPFADSSQIPTFLVSQLARQHVTVALSGDGGDELFSGYTRYVAAEAMRAKFARLPQPLRVAAGRLLTLLPPNQVDSLIKPLRGLIPSRWRYKQFGNKLHKLGSICRSDDPLAVYRALISMWERPSDVVIACHDVDQLASLPPAVGKVATFTERMMLTDLLTYLPDDILVKVDRASMGVSLEARVPFLDHRVIEHALGLPLDLKLRNGEGKWILRQVLYRYVPRELIDRPKMGFGVPVDEWLRGPLHEWASDLLHGDRLRADGYFHDTEVHKKWQEHTKGSADRAALLWPILMFQAWHDHYGRS